VARTLRRHDSAKTREDLLDAASTLFFERGFDATTTDAIARRARVNKAMIHYHFGTKEKLYRHILASGIEEVAQAIRRSYTASDPPELALRRAASAWVGVAVERPHLARLIMREVITGGGRIDEVLLPRILAVFGMTRDLVEKGVRSRRFHRVDPFLTHLTLAGSIVFFFASEPLRQRVRQHGNVPNATPPVEAFVKHLHDVVIGGLLMKPHKRSVRS